MQRIYETALSPKEYQDQQGHWQVIPESVCPRCGQGFLHRHGVYGRWISWLSQTLRIFIARFFCTGCGRTISYLPQFALSYRLLNTATVQDFLEGEEQRPEVQSWRTLLQSYQRALQRFAPELIRTVGSGLGLPPPERGAQAWPIWPWLKGACGSLKSAARQLVSEFKITLFARYQCHQAQCG